MMEDLELPDLPYVPMYVRGSSQDCINYVHHHKAND